MWVIFTPKKRKIGGTVSDSVGPSPRAECYMTGERGKKKGTTAVTKS
jgi:hypothetical protein